MIYLLKIENVFHIFWKSYYADCVSQAKDSFVNPLLKLRP